MTFCVTFKIYGDPVAKGRPRFTKTGRTYTPKKTHDYESEVAMMAKAAMGSSEPLETPVEVFVYVTFPIPASYSKKRAWDCLNGSEKHTKRPDLDNCIKAVTDGMNGVVYKDDCQITGFHAKKVYGDIGMVEVMVKEDLE
jgi:Holliday junction resolvase RusA-like endonuclease